MIGNKPTKNLSGKPDTEWVVYGVQNSVKCCSFIGFAIETGFLPMHTYCGKQCNTGLGSADCIATR